MQSHVPRAASNPGSGPATSRFGTTNAAIGVAAASRSCSAASKIGAGSSPDTTAVPRPSSPPSPSRPLSSSGCDQRGLTLRRRYADSSCYAQSVPAVLLGFVECRICQADQLVHTVPTCFRDRYANRCCHSPAPPGCRVPNTGFANVSTYCVTQGHGLLMVPTHQQNQKFFAAKAKGEVKLPLACSDRVQGRNYCPSDCLDATVSSQMTLRVIEQFEMVYVDHQCSNLSLKLL